MSTISTRLLLFFLLLPVSAAIAQYKAFPDSIKVEFRESKSIVFFQLNQYETQRSLIKSFPSVLSSLTEQIKKSIPFSDLTSPQRVDVRFSQEGKLEGFVGHERFSAETGSEQFDIDITKQTPSTSLTVKQNTITELLPPGWQMKITGRDFIISVYCPDFTAMESLSKVDLEPVIASLNKQIEGSYTGRKGINARIVHDANEVSYAKVDLAPIQDMLGIHVGAGIGLVQDRFYPEINMSTALYFANRHNVPRQRIELSYELKFFPGSTEEGGYKTLTNNFLNLSYSRNFSRERPRWFGFGVGYLMNSKGDVYQGETMKFFVESDIGSSKINLVPEFYLTNDFKDFSFGLKLQYKF